jgi:hypothetical protein
MLVVILYSLYRAPILHQWSYYFFIPMFLLAAVSIFVLLPIFFQRFFFRVFIVLCFFDTVSNRSLWVTRTHYGDFRWAIEQTVSMADSAGRNNLIVLPNLNTERYADYYNSRLSHPFDFASLRKLDSLQQSAVFVDTCSASKLAYFTANRGELSDLEVLLRACYNKNLRTEYADGARAWLGERDSTILKLDTISDSFISYAEGSEYLSGNVDTIETDVRFALAFGWINWPLDSSFSEWPLLVLQVESNGQVIQWMGIPINQYQKRIDDKVLVVAAIEARSRWFIDSVVKAYWWHRAKTAISASVVQLQLVP